MQVLTTILETLRCFFFCVCVWGCVCVCLDERNISLVAIWAVIVLQRPCNEAALSPGIDAF